MWCGSQVWVQCGVVVRFGCCVVWCGSQVWVKWAAFVDNAYCNSFGILNESAEL